MELYWFLLGGFAAWRVTHLLQREDGPWRVSAGLRQRAGTGFWGDLLDCFYCLSLWMSLPFALLLGTSWGERLLLWPALSAFAIVVERLTQDRASPPPAAYIEDPVEKEER